MKRLFTFVSITAALLLSTNVFASIEILSGAPMHSGIVSGWYAGVGGGYGGMVTSKLGRSAKQSTVYKKHSKQEVRGLVGRIFLGYLWNVPNVTGLKAGVESGYVAYEDNRYELGSRSFVHLNWRYSGYHVDLLGVGRYNLAETGWNIIGKAGLAYVSQQVSVGHGNTPNPIDDEGLGKVTTKILPKLAIGFGYDFNPSMSMGISADYVFGNKPASPFSSRNKDALTRIAPVTTVLLNLTYHINS